jgi:hypothetical protein
MSEIAYLAAARETVDRVHGLHRRLRPVGEEEE